MSFILAVASNSQRGGRPATVKARIEYQKFAQEALHSLLAESFATLSNGKSIPNHHWYQKAEAQLRRAQRKVARRKEVATKKPGIIYLTIRCYSWDGPWWNRAGFDMEALTVSGFTIAEAGGLGHRPGFPSTMVLNDFIAGYMGAMPH